MEDPFATAAVATDPGPEPQQQDPWASPPPVAWAPAVPAGATATAVASPSVGEIVTTFKAGTGYDSPWVVLHASSVAESDALLDKEFADYLGKVKRVAEFFNGGSSASAQGGNTQQRSNAPQGATQPPSYAPPKPYDDFVYKSGVSKFSGKTWEAWMPPEKGDSREPKFFYPPR